MAFLPKMENNLDALSDKITVQVVHILKSDYEDMNVKAKEEYFNTVSFFVRKTGHFGEYGILGVLISTFLLTFEKIRNKKRYIVILITTIIGMVYASSDEVHQNFVEGRSPKVMDVCIDTTGCSLWEWFLLTMMCFSICRRKRKMWQDNIRKVTPYTPGEQPKDQGCN